MSAALCTQTHRVVAFDNARVYVMNEDGRTLDAVAFRPHAAEYAGESAAGLRVRVGEGITGWVAATGRPLNVRDAAADPRALDVPGTMDLTEESMLLAPLRSEGGVIGVVVLSRLGLNRFSDDELRLLRRPGRPGRGRHRECPPPRRTRPPRRSSWRRCSTSARRAEAASEERELAALLAAKLRQAAAMEACLIIAVGRAVRHARPDRRRRTSQ